MHKFLFVLQKFVSISIDQYSSLSVRYFSPRSVKRVMGCLHCKVNVFRTRFCDLGDEFIGCWVKCIKGVT